MKQKLPRALVVLDSRENSWFLSGDSQESLDCELLDVKGLRVIMEDFDRALLMIAGKSPKCGCDMGQAMVLFFADVDGLKSINDRFGHGEGDRALARAAACIKQTFRKFDLTARLSGDEFVALTVEVPGRSTAAICKR